MNHKPTFLNQNKPLITAMIQESDLSVVMRRIRKARFDGADAFGFQLEDLDKKYRSEDNLKAIFSAMGSCPAYVTNYRYCMNQGDTDEECVKGLETMVKCGATLVDVMGDLYNPHPIQLTEDAGAVSRQIDTIKKFHDMGAEVLMSSHVMKFIDGDEVLRIAEAQMKRGADISKIVTAADSEAEEIENLRTVERLKRELEIPFLFLAGGSHNKILRQIGPFLGEVMWLTVIENDEYSTVTQPLLSSIRAIADNFDRY